MKLIRRKALLEKTGLTASTQHRLELAGLFPQRRKMSDRSCGWVEAEVDQWIEGRQPVTAENVKPAVTGGMRRGRKPTTQAA